MIALKVIIKIYILVKWLFLFLFDKLSPQKYPRMRLDKFDFVSLINENATCLEIGPFNKPLLSGKKVKYFDVLNSEQLIERAKKLGLNYDNVPFIDFVSSVGDLTVINQCFSVILSSHAIEHQVDFVAHLQIVEQLLEDNGYYFLVIPDRRYSFDYYLSESSIAQIINAHLNPRARHSLTSVIEHRALTTHNNPYLHLLGAHGLGNFDKQAKIQSAVEEYNLEHGYIDVHAWYFTPKSFESIMQDLYSLGYINLVVDKVYPTVAGKLEFFVILRKV